MIRNLISCNEPVCNECVVGVTQGGKVGHFRSASVWILTVGKELVDSAQSI